MSVKPPALGYRLETGKCLSAHYYFWVRTHIHSSHICHIAQNKVLHVNEIGRGLKSFANMLTFPKILSCKRYIIWCAPWKVDMYPLSMMNSQKWFGLTGTISSIESDMGNIEEAFAYSNRLSLLYKAYLHFHTTTTNLKNHWWDWVGVPHFQGSWFIVLLSPQAPSGSLWPFGPLSFILTPLGSTPAVAYGDYMSTSQRNPPSIFPS